MSRRKHVLQSVLQQHADPPGPGQHIVRAVGSRGSNIIEVEFPEGRTTLCLLPAKFHKKLWIKRGSFLIVEGAADEVDGRVTGQILRVLYEDQVKHLKRMAGVWPAAFDGTTAPCAAVQAAATSLEQLGLDGRAEADDGDGQPGSGSVVEHARPSGRAAAPAAAGEQQGSKESEEYSSDDSLPPIQQINNRRVIEYEVSDSDSDDAG